MRTDILSAGLIVLAACQRGGGDSAAGAQAAADSTSPAPAAQGLIAYVTNEASEELSVIDTRTDSVIATIPVGTRPRGVRLTPDGKTIFVALSGSPRCPPTMPDEECEKLKADKSKDGIAVVDAAARKVMRVLPGGSDPENFDISKDGSTLFVSNEDAGEAEDAGDGTGEAPRRRRRGARPPSRACGARRGARRRGG